MQEDKRDTPKRDNIKRKTNDKEGKKEKHGNTTSWRHVPLPSLRSFTSLPERERERERERNR